MTEQEARNPLDFQMEVIRRGVMAPKKQVAIREINETDISLLKSHPRNKEIYGSEDVSDLVALIQERGRIVTPLVVNKDYTIISGHRRWLAAKELEYPTAPCEIIEFASEEEELEELIHYNAGRNKTFEQRIRESITLEEVYSVKAKKRSIENLKQNKTDMDNLAGSEDSDVGDPIGDTRDVVASKVGISSGKTYERGKKVIQTVDLLRKKGNNDDADLLISILKNKSVSAAADLADESILASLSEEVKRELKSGKTSVRSIIPKMTDDIAEKKSQTGYTMARGHIKVIANATKELKKADLAGLSTKQKENLQGDIESIINSLQELLSSD